MDRGTELLQQEFREMGILAKIALNHPPDCSCEVVCRKLRRHYPAHISAHILLALLPKPKD